MKIITVDAGKYNTKAITKLENGELSQLDFRTKLQKTNTSYFTNDTFHLKWKEQNYILGDGAKHIDLDTNKQKLQHKLAVYVSCAKLTQNNSGEQDIDELNLIVLSPMSIFSHKQKRDEFRDYIMDDKIVNFELFNQEKTIIVNNCEIFAETGGIIFSNPQHYKNRVIGIIDIGGVN